MFNNHSQNTNALLGFAETMPDLIQRAYNWTRGIFQSMKVLVPIWKRWNIIIKWRKIDHLVLVLAMKYI